MRPEYIRAPMTLCITILLANSLIAQTTDVASISAAPLVYVSAEITDNIFEPVSSVAATALPAVDTSSKLGDHSAKTLPVFTQCWDNTKFHACQDMKVKLPFAVSFADSQYATPVQRDLVITSRYGWRGGQAHHGIDIDLVTGDQVMAMLPGKVRLVRYIRGMGNTIIIRHENGLETIYGHLSKQLVKENQWIEKGQVIGKGGTTGNARGSHLHLGSSLQGEEH